MPTYVRRLTTAMLIRCVGPIAAAVALAASADAQTTITINQPDTQVWTATVRGGTYAKQNLSTILETRASDTAEYRRRALLKFDTQNLIAAGTPVTSAILTLTVKQASGDSSRKVGVYQVTNSWEEPQVTWNSRKTGAAWLTAGGDYGTKLAESAVSNTVGTRVSFDVTPLVQQAVRGALGSSRYTRVALLDNGNSTSGSWRAYYTAEEIDPALRPTLTVTYGAAAATPAPDPNPHPRLAHRRLRPCLRLRRPRARCYASCTGILRRTDGEPTASDDPKRVVSRVVKMNPDIISFNEMEKWNQVQPLRGRGRALSIPARGGDPRREVVHVGHSGLRFLDHQGPAQHGLFEDPVHLDLPHRLRRRKAESGRRRDDRVQRPQHQLHDDTLRPVYGVGPGSLRRRKARVVCQRLR